MSQRNKRDDEFGTAPEEYPSAAVEEYVRQCAEEAIVAEAISMPGDEIVPPEYPTTVTVKPKAKKSNIRKIIASQSSALVAAVIATATVLTSSGVISLPLFSSGSRQKQSESVSYEKLSESFLAFCNTDESVAVFGEAFDLLAAEKFDRLFVTLWSNTDYLDRFFEALGKNVYSAMDFDGRAFASAGELSNPLYRIYLIQSESGNEKTFTLEPLLAKYPTHSSRFDFSYRFGTVSQALTCDFLSAYDADNVVIREYISHDDGGESQLYIEAGDVIYATVRNGVCCGDTVMMEGARLLSGDMQYTGRDYVEFRFPLDENGLFDWDKLRVGELNMVADMNLFMNGELDVLIDEDEAPDWDSDRMRRRVRHSSGRGILGVVLLRSVENYEDKPYVIEYDWAWSPDGDIKPVDVGAFFIGR